MKHYKIFWKINERNLTKLSTQVKRKLKWGFKTLKLSFLYNTQNHNVCKSQEFRQLKHVHSSVPSVEKKMMFKFSTISCSCNTYHHCCAITSRIRLGRIWFTVTFIYRNMQVATVTIDCIYLLQGTWVLAWGKWVHRIKLAKCANTERDNN